MPDYTIRVTMKDVAEGDAHDLAQHVWDEFAEDYDAKLGNFEVDVSRGGFPTDWQPQGDPEGV